MKVVLPHVVRLADVHGMIQEQENGIMVDIPPGEYDAEVLEKDEVSDIDIIILFTRYGPQTACLKYLKDQGASFLEEPLDAFVMLHSKYLTAKENHQEDQKKALKALSDCFWDRLTDGEKERFRRRPFALNQFSS